MAGLLRVRYIIPNSGDVGAIEEPVTRGNRARIWSNRLKQ